MRLLLIEDDFDLATTVGEYLSAKGHDVHYAYDGHQGLELGQRQAWDAIVLDLGLPGMDGLDVCRRLRTGTRSETPILMLTARDALEDRLAGFRVGTDDYLIKPFALSELEVRVLAIDRRARRSGETQLEVLDLVFDTKTMQVHRAGVSIAMNRTGMLILEVLMRASPAVVPREQLVRIIWNDEEDDRDVLRTHIYHLRRAIDRPFNVALLHTVHGVGYRIADVRKEA
ncbi:MAG: response regulator transcription factor [Planctomycetota bacterium]